MILFEELAAAVPMEEVISQLGISINRNGRFTCPDPAHNDKHPSCSIIRGNRYKCWSCISDRSSGSIIDVVKLYRGLTTAESCEWICDTFGLDKAHYMPDSKKSKGEKKMFLSSTQREALGIVNHPCRGPVGIRSCKQDCDYPMPTLDEDYVETKELSRNPLLDLDEEALKFLIQSRKKEMKRKLSLAKIINGNWLMRITGVSKQDIDYCLDKLAEEL